MSIQELGAIGEFFSSIAVLITLIYIAMQARRTKSTAIAEAARELNTGYNASLISLTNDDIAKLTRLGLSDWNSLTRNEQL